jgi:hypothetical protein
MFRIEIREVKSKGSRPHHYEIMKPEHYEG